MSDLEDAADQPRKQIAPALALSEIRERARSRREHRRALIAASIAAVALMSTGVAIAFAGGDEPQVATPAREQRVKDAGPSSGPEPSDPRVELLAQPSTVTDEDVVFITTPVGAPPCRADNAVVIVTGPSAFRHEGTAAVIRSSDGYNGLWRYRSDADEFPEAGQYSVVAACEGSIDYVGAFTRLQSGAPRPVVALVVENQDPRWLRIGPPLTAPPCIGGSGTLTITGPPESDRGITNGVEIKTNAEYLPRSRPQEHGYWWYDVPKDALAGPGRYSISATCTGSENGTIRYTGEMPITQVDLDEAQSLLDELNSQSTVTDGP
jgi:hypothetical protein